MRKFFFNLLLVLLWQMSLGQQNIQFNCSTDGFKKNKNNTATQAEKEILIQIQWIEIYQDIKFMSSLSSNLGKDLAYMKTKEIKISLKKYEKQIDSVVKAIQKIRVITETEELVEAEYCYLLHTKLNIAKMDYLITHNDPPAGINKALDFLSQFKTQDHLEMAKVGELLNQMAKKYDLYKYR